MLKKCQNLPHLPSAARGAAPRPPPVSHYLVESTTIATEPLQKYCLPPFHYFCACQSHGLFFIEVDTAQVAFRGPLHQARPLAQTSSYATGYVGLLFVITGSNKILKGKLKSTRYQLFVFFAIGYLLVQILLCFEMISLSMHYNVVFCMY